MSLAAYTAKTWTDYADAPDLSAANVQYMDSGIAAVTAEVIALELALPTTYQPVSAELSALAGLSSTGYAKRTGAGAWSVSATIPQADVSGLNAALAAKEPVLGNPGTSGYLLSSTTAGVRSWVAPYAHPATHPQSVVDSASGWITTALAGKQAAGSYAAASHAHAIADVTGLQTALDGKQAAGSYLTAASSLDPAKIAQTASYRFVSDTEKAAWNAKQAAITTGTTAQYLRGDLSLATFPTSWAWGSLTGVPSTFAPSAHTHSAITSSGLAPTSASAPSAWATPGLDVRRATNTGSYPSAYGNILSLNGDGYGQIQIGMSTGASPENRGMWFRNSRDVIDSFSSWARVLDTASDSTAITQWNTAYTHSQTSGNPHGTTAAQVGALAVEAQAADSAKLGGQLPSYYALESTIAYTGTGAVDPNTLTGLQSGYTQNTALNRPGNYAFVQTLARYNNGSMQIASDAYSSDSNSLWWRRKGDNGTWYPWKTIWHTGNLAFGTGNADMARGDHAHSTLYQPLNSDLTAIAGLSSTGYAKRTGAGAWSVVASIPAADLTGTIAAARMPALTGDVTSTVGTVATSIAASVVTGKALTGYAVGANSALAATDTILAAMGKLQGQLNDKFSATISRTAKTFLAAPNAADGNASFRLIVAADLPVSGVTAGAYGSASVVPVPTVDAYGRITSMSTATITPASIGAQVAGSYVTLDTQQTISGIKAFSATPVLNAGMTVYTGTRTMYMLNSAESILFRDSVFATVIAKIDLQNGEFYANKLSVANVNSHLNPAVPSAYDIGSSGTGWRNLYVDYIQSLELKTQKLQLIGSQYFISGSNQINLSTSYFEFNSPDGSETVGVMPSSAIAGTVMIVKGRATGAPRITDIVDVANPIKAIDGSTLAAATVRVPVIGMRKFIKTIAGNWQEF